MLLVLAGAITLTLLWQARDRSANTQRDVLGSSPKSHQSSSSTAASAGPGSGRLHVYAAIARGRFSPTVAGDRSLVYVPNGELGTVEEIDPTTYEVIRRFHVGLYPEHVTPSWDLRRLYVDTSTWSTLAVIDPKTGRMVRTIRGIDHPYNLYFIPDGSKAIVVAEYLNRLDFRNPHTWRLIKSLPIPGAGPTTWTSLPTDGSC